MKRPTATVFPIRRRLALTVMLYLLGVLPLTGQERFGTNTVQSRTFSWQQLVSSHFDVFYYDRGRVLAQFTATAAEDAFRRIRRDLRWVPRERVAFLVFNSEEEGRQHNVGRGLAGVSVKRMAGFDHLRVLVAFDGDYHAFRETVVRELTRAVLRDLLYTGSVTALARGEYAPVAEWFETGLAEFEAQEWSTQLDMILRDAAARTRMPSLPGLERQIEPAGAAAVFEYIARAYGRAKIGDIAHQLRNRKSLPGAIQTVLGVSYAGFIRNWHRYLKKRYWPEIANRRLADDFAEPLLSGDGSEVHPVTHPVLSPDGRYLAAIRQSGEREQLRLWRLEDRRDSRMLADASFSRGSTYGRFAPGLAFSPDGERIAFAALRDNRSVLAVADVTRGDIREYPLGLWGIRHPAWSPDGASIVVSAHDGRHRDLFRFWPETDRLARLTDDPFLDDQPAWSPDGQGLVFVSDRRSYLRPAQLPLNFTMSRYHGGQADLYWLSLPTMHVVRLTDTPWNELQPLVTPDTGQVLFLSDRNGISNLYKAALRTGRYTPVTNTVSGVYHISMTRGAERLGFVTYERGQHQVYLLANPLRLTELELANTRYREEIWTEDRDADFAALPDTLSGADGTAPTAVAVQPRPRMRPLALDSGPATWTGGGGDSAAPSRSPADGQRPSAIRLDALRPGMDRHPLFGLRGIARIRFGELFGDRQFQFTLTATPDVDFYGVRLRYLHLRERLDWGVSGYNQVALFALADGRELRHRLFGLELESAWPINRHHRLEVSADLRNTVTKNLDSGDPAINARSVVAAAALVHDDTRLAPTGPMEGSRLRLSGEWSPPLTSTSRVFRGLRIDARRYLEVWPAYVLAGRVSAGAGWGESPRQYRVGGIDNWLDPAWARPREVESAGAVFYDSFVGPLRGADLYAAGGDHYVLANAELRFPLIQYLGTGLVPMRLFNVRGALFFDIGGAWDRATAERWRGTGRNAAGERRLRDLAGGFGVGARFSVLAAVVKVDMAWGTDLDAVSKPRYYVSLGREW